MCLNLRKLPFTYIWEFHKARGSDKYSCEISSSFLRISQSHNIGNHNSEEAKDATFSHEMTEEAR